MPSENTRRIAKNTAMLYIRMLLIMVVTLYTSRVVLNVLGVEDFGIYNVVGGFIAMFSVISASLSAAISRFITFELGRENKEKIQKIFSTSVIIQLIISVIILLLSETAGLWFLNTQMVIPPERMGAANWVFQFSLFTFIVNLVSVPYNASIIAYERMTAFAYIGIVQAAGTLLIAFLIRVSPMDRLTFYALLTMVLAVLIRILYGWYCRRHFRECRFRWIYEKTLIKEIFGFAGWNFIGASSGVLRDQGINVILNIFCGPAVNAARGIAMQVSSAVTVFSNNFMTALNPQITKSFATGDRDYWVKLVFQGARFSFYLLLFLSLPILVETHAVLALWLKLVPGYTVVFVRLILLYVMIESLSFTMITLMLATGRIRNYQLIVGGCQMLNFPVAYVLMRMGFVPEWTIVGSIVIACCCLVLRLSMLRRMVGFPVWGFCKDVILNAASVAGASVLLPLAMTFVMNEGLGYFLLNVIICIFSTGTAILYIGLSREERRWAWGKLKGIYREKRIWKG